jgi:hypothetical protein
LGKTKDPGETSACQKERRAHARWPKKAFSANEGSLGGTKESRRDQNSSST